MLTSENFTVKLAKANLAGKNDIANFVKTGVDNTLKNVTSIKNELNELSRKVKALSKKKKKKNQKIWWKNLVYLMKLNIFLQEYFKII